MANKSHGVGGSCLAASAQVTAHQQNQHSSLHRLHAQKAAQNSGLDSPTQLSQSLHRGEQETLAASISGQHLLILCLQNIW